MNKKLMVAAVAGALALPGVALAQSSVTISGIFKVGVDQYKVGGRAGNSSENRVTDNSSRIIFNVTEDLGGGLAAVAQLDLRFSPDQAGAAATNPIGSGSTWVGLRSKTLGTLTLGRHDLHYGKNQEDLVSKAGALMASSTSLMDATSAGGATTAIAGNTRTQNVVRWDSPNWSGFRLTGAYSSNPTGQDADLTAGAGRKGSAWTFNPSYTAKNWNVGYSYWKSKVDASVGAVPADQRGDVISGGMNFGGLKVGLAWNKSELKNAATGVKTADRTAWSLPVSYNMGAHTFYGTYTKAGNDKTTAANDSAKMFALAYNYDLSKRTAVGLTYAQITNEAAAAYTFFTQGAFGSVNAAPAAGQDPRLVALTLRHAF